MRRRLAKELTYDSNATLSLGRILAIWFSFLFSACVVTLLGLLCYEVAHGREAEAAGLASAVGVPLSAVITLLGTLAQAPYIVGKVWPQGGASAAQLDAQEPAA